MAPRQEVFARPGVTVEEGPEGIGAVVDGVHAGQLAGGDERHEHDPVFGADLVACDAGVLSGQRDRVDLGLDRVGVEREGDIIEEADQVGPVTSADGKR